MITRTRRTQGISTRGTLSRLFLLLIVLAGISGLIVQTGAFSAITADRGVDVGVANDQTALIGVDLADSVTVGGGGGGGASCNFGTNDLVVDPSQSTDVATTRDVVVQGNPVDVAIETEGCVRLESGTRLTGPVSAAGDVTVGSGSRLNGDVDADGDVTVESGGMLTGYVTAGGDVTTNTGARLNGGVDADGDVTVGSGSQADGDIEAGGDVAVGSGGRILGDVVAGGTVNVDNGGRISGSVQEDAGGGSGGEQHLLSLQNNLDHDVTATVTLQSPGDGTLVANGDSGISVQVYLTPGVQQDIAVVPSESPGGSIGVEIAAESVSGGYSVTLERSVSTTTGG